MSKKVVTLHENDCEYWTNSSFYPDAYVQLTWPRREKPRCGDVRLIEGRLWHCVEYCSLADGYIWKPVTKGMLHDQTKT